MRTNRLVACALAAVPLASSARAADWIVDDDGGPGVDFTTFAAAVTAADHGDRVFVRPGFYPATVASDKGLSVLGTGDGVVLAGDYFWHDLPVERELRFSNVALGPLILERCRGSVLLSQLDMANLSAGLGLLSAKGCADVRAWDCEIETLLGSAVFVERSRVELVGCTITGDRGPDGNLVEGGGDGGDGVRVLFGGSLVIADSLVTGGRGGDAISGIGGGLFGGNGGRGAFVDVGALMIVKGDSSNAIRGGDAGEGPDFTDDGQGGHGIHVEGEVRISGALFEGGHSPDFVDGNAMVGAGSFVQLSPPDPFLELDGDATAGATLDVRVNGPAGADVVLMAGRAPRVGVWPGAPDPLLLEPARVFPLGAISGTGMIYHSIPLPAGLAPGTRFVLQARFEDGAATRLSNSTPFVVH